MKRLKVKAHWQCALASKAGRIGFTEKNNIKLGLLQTCRQSLLKASRRAQPPPPDELSLRHRRDQPPEKAETTGICQHNHIP